MTAPQSAREGHRGTVPFRTASYECRHRKMLAEANGHDYLALPSLDAARLEPDATVILESGASEQVYVVAPIAEVRCDADALLDLLLGLDAVAWLGRDAAAARIFFERRRVGSAIAGGSGGGRVIDGIWIHSQFERTGLRPQILQALGNEAIGGSHGDR